MNLLEEEAQRLKEKYNEHLHPTIDENLKWLTRQMDVRPGGIAVQEGMVALSSGLPNEAH
jgi:hypothetical protein